MKLNLIGTKEILDFEKEIGHELVVNERPEYMKLPRFYVSFKGGEISEGTILSGEFGQGNTVDEALQDYCKVISSRRMVFGAFRPERKEIILPKLIHTRLINYYY